MTKLAHIKDPHSKDLAAMTLMLSNKLMDLSTDEWPVGLFYGKMGICIYYYHLARKTNSPDYQKFAEKLLDEVICSMNEDISIDFDIGLSGIAWGLMHLVEQSFVQGDIDEALEQIDDKIYHDLSFLWIDKAQRDAYAQMKILLYLIKRLKNGKITKEKNFIYKALIVKTINYVDNNLRTDDLEEPFIFDVFSYHLPFYIYTLSVIYAEEIYTDKIERIWRGLSEKILSTFPRLHTNRLFMLFALCRVNKRFRMAEWEKHINMLEENMDMKIILDTELKDKSIFARNGIVGCCYMSLLSDNLKLKKDIYENRPEIETFILKSSVWEECLNHSHKLIQYAGIMNGFTGISLLHNFFLDKSV